MVKLVVLESVDWKRLVVDVVDAADIIVVFRVESPAENPENGWPVDCRVSFACANAAAAAAAFD